MEEGINLLYIALAAVFFVVFAGIWYRADLQEYQGLMYVEGQLNQERAVRGVE